LPRLASQGLLRARALPAVRDVARVALVQTAASLLSGDRIEIAIRCGPGCRLELVEVAGTIAHDVRGGPAAHLTVRVELAPGARLAWLAQPLVLAAGCGLERSSVIHLGEGAVMLQRDTVLLGRHGEPPGRMHSDLVVRVAGYELLVETLDTGDLELLRSPVVFGDARVADTVALYGTRGDDDAALQLAGPGSVLPVLAPSLAAAERRTAAVLARWRADLFTSRHPDDDAHDGPRVALASGRTR